MQKVHHPAFTIPERTEYIVRFNVQGGKEPNLYVSFDNEDEARFYEYAFEQGLLQVISSRFIGIEYYSYDVTVFVYTTSIKHLQHLFLHDKDLWKDLSTFMHQFGSGTRMSTNLLGFWYEWDGTDWVDCIAPYKASLQNTKYISR